MDSTAEELDLTFARAIEGAESDTVAIETLSSLVGSNQVLAKRLAEKIGEQLHSNQATEVVNVLDVLEICMNNIEIFRYEIGRFKFLNEIVKLISPSRATRTVPVTIRDRIMDLMLIWTRQYPSVHKIKEAYDLMIKQGVPHVASKDHQIDRSNGGQISRRPVNDTSTQFDDIPKHLWTSTDPADVQAVNLMVEKALEKGKRLDELRLKYVAELKEAAELSSVLEELLDTYSIGESSEDDTALISEMFEQCRAMQICISRYAVDPNNKDLATSLATNDRLQEVMQRYRSVVVEGKRNNQFQPPSEAPLSNTDLLASLLSSTPHSSSTPTMAPLNIPLPDPLSGDLDDIFQQPIQPDTTLNGNQPSMDLLKFTIDLPAETPNSINAPMLTPSVFCNIESKKPCVVPPKENKPNHVGDFFGLDSTISGLKISLVQSDKADKTSEQHPDLKINPLPLVEEPDSLLITNPIAEPDVEATKAPSQISRVLETPLSELAVDLDNIHPSSHPTKIILDEINGLKIVLNFALDKPRNDTAVIVITTTNHSREAVSGFELDASVTKPCKVRLLPASGHTLPGVKPFRPPTEDITQLLLVANKENISPLRITCIVTYCLGDDPDPIKECITIDNLPALH